jgi:hypothetical protein
MSRVEEAIDTLIQQLENAGYETKDAIKKVNEDLDGAKAEIQAYNDWVQDRIELYLEV